MHRQMTAIEYLKERSRLTDNCAIDCNDCVLGRTKNGTKHDCDAFQLLYPEIAVKYVYEWAKENPVFTRKMDYFKKFPNANKKGDNNPTICVRDLGYKEYGLGCIHIPETINYYCNECWNKPVDKND